MRQMGLWSAAAEVETARGRVVTREPVRAEIRLENPTELREAEPAEPRPAEPRTAQHLAEFLLAVVGKRIRLTITDNRRAMMTCSVRRGVMHLRLHHMFLSAPQEVWDALALYLADDDRDGRAGGLIDRFIEANMHRVRREGVRIQPSGRIHDLQDIFDRLNAQFFHGASKARVTWGRAGSSSYRRSIQLGCYVAEDDLIRMHPSLDQSFVPEFYVAWVLFHEMLHEAYGVEEVNGRRHVHPPEFTALEQTHPDYERAKAWEQRHLPRLLRYRHRS